MRAFLIAAAVVSVLSVAAVVGIGQTKPSTRLPIEGVWKGTSTIVTGANSANSILNRQPNIVIFTKGHCSLITMAGTAPRPVLAPPKDPANLTNAEKLARYEHWEPVGATSGRYEVKGTTLYQYALVGKNQTAAIIERSKTGNMGTVAVTSEITFQGNDTMIHIEKSAPSQPVSETRRTYTRLAPLNGGLLSKRHVVEGVWQGTSTIITGPNASSSPTRQPNISIYVNGYYSTIRQDAGFPPPDRQVLAQAKDPAKPTDAEKLARYEHWAPVAINAGRYEVMGTQLYHWNLVARNQTADMIETQKTGKLGTAAPILEITFPDSNTMVQVDKRRDGPGDERRTFTRLEVIVDR